MIANLKTSKQIFTICLGVFSLSSSLKYFPRIRPLEANTCGLNNVSEVVSLLLRTHIRQERSEYTLQNLLGKARQEPHTVSVLAFPLQIVIGMR